MMNMMMNSSEEDYLKWDYSPGFLGMNSKRENPISSSGYPKRQKKQQKEDNTKSEGSPQVEFCIPGLDGGHGRRGGGRYSLRELRDPRLGHAQFLKDKLSNPFLLLPPEYQRPDFIQDPDNPVVGFRFNASSRLPIPITARDSARESIQKYQNTPSQLLPFGGTTFPSGPTFPMGISRPMFPSGYGSTGMASDPPLHLSEDELVRQTIQRREEEAKKLDDKVRDEPEQLRKGDLRCAQEAIKFYNATHGTSYEVVATLGSYHHLDCGHWYHCNFKAYDANSRSSQPKLFFSELFCPGAGLIGAKVCKMLDGPGPRPYTVRGCKICGDQLLHPVNGFECGK